MLENQLHGVEDELQEVQCQLRENEVALRGEGYGALNLDDGCIVPQGQRQTNEHYKLP